MLALPATSPAERRRSLTRRVRRYRVLYVLFLPAFVYFLTYKYYPIVLQTVLSLKDFNLSGGIWGSPWVGLEKFSELLSSAQFGRLLRNPWADVDRSATRKNRF